MATGLDVILPGLFFAMERSAAPSDVLGESKLVTSSIMVASLVGALIGQIGLGHEPAPFVVPTVGLSNLGLTDITMLFSFVGLGAISGLVSIAFICKRCFRLETLASSDGHRHDLPIDLGVRSSGRDSGRGTTHPQEDPRT